MNQRGEAVTILVIIGLLALGAYTFLTVSSSSPTGLTSFETSAITACGNINASDNLTQDISTGASCLNITADNVVIDCQGFAVNFNGANGIGDIGIHAQSRNNITIRNCFINDTGSGGTSVYGIAFDNVSNALIENNNFSIRGGAADHAGVRITGDYTFASLSSSDNNVVRNNFVFVNGSFAGDGILIQVNVSNNTIENNNVILVNVSNLGTCCGDALEISGTGNGNIIRNNTVNATKGRALTLSSVSNSVVENNQLNVSDSSSFSAFVISTVDSSNISSNSLILTTDGSGVSFGSNTNTIFENNNLTLNVPVTNTGISASGTNTESIIRNNNLSTTGSLGVHPGIVMSSTVSLTIFNNTITTVGTTGSNNYGLSLTSSQSNNISQNTIRTNSTGPGTGTNRGIYASNGDSNNIHDNIISTDGIIGTNEGIKLDGGSDSNNVTRNNITTRGTGAGGNIGIYLEFLADHNIISYNTINTTGGGSNDHGIALFARNVTTGGGGGGGASIEGFEVETPNPVTCPGANPCESVSNNWIYRNIIRSNGTDQSHGIYLRSETVEIGGGGGGGASIEGFETETALNSLNTSVTGNLIQENTVLNSTHSNIVGSNGIQLEGIYGGNNAVNNSFLNNNVTNSSGAGVAFISSSAGSTFNGTRIITPNVWLNASASTSHNFTNTTFATSFGIIRIISNFTFNGLDSVQRSELNITQNIAFVNSTANSFLNQSSHITFTGLTGANHVPVVSFNDNGTFETCNATQCTNVVYSGGTLDFDVASFTTYSSLNVAGLSVNLSKSDFPDPVENGTQLNYTIIFNVTNGTAANITITEVYPANVSFSSASPAPNISNNTWQPSDLTNSSFEINVTVIVDATAPNASVLNNTIVTSFNNVSGGNLSLNVSELTTVNVSAAANLTPTILLVAKTDSPDPVNNGSQLNYTINVTVTQGNATNVTVVDNFPSGVTFSSSTPANTSNGTWSLGNLVNGTTVLINITVNVNSNASGILTNNVNVTFQNASNETNTVSASTTTTVNVGLTPTVLIITKTDSPDPVNNGSQLNYTINVTVTQGNATNVTVVDAFPSTVTFDSSTPANTSANIWALGNLTSGTTVLINITVNVSASASGTLTNNVNVTFQNASNQTITQSASASTTVNSGSASSGGGSGGGSGGSGGVICPPLCQYPENKNLPVCINNCPQETEFVAPPVQELPNFPTTSDSVDTSAGLPQSEPAIPIEEETVEVVEEKATNRTGFAKFFPWLILLVLIALIIAILSHSKKGSSKPAPIAIKTSVTRQSTNEHSKETEEILNNIRKSEERLKKLLNK